jgi:ABC-type molybdate transport system ATPase subunit
MDQARRLAEYVVRLDGGEVVSAGPVAEVLTA